MPEVDYERLEMAHLTPRQSIDLSTQETNHGLYAWSGPDDLNKPNSQSITTHDELLASDSRSIGETSATYPGLSTPSLKPTSKSILSSLGSWWREIVAMIISIASLSSIAAVLLVYQHRPLSEWQFRYLPNAVVSQLMTISRSALMFSTASSVSQNLWVYIQQKPRSLIEIQSFDDASRGPFGAALMLAYATRYCLPALLGSFITIATLLMESFTQQVLRFPLRPDIGKVNATYPTTQHFVYAPEQDTSFVNAVNSSIQAAFVDSVFGNAPKDPFVCPTSNFCSWEPASTLGLCSTCTDITHTTKVVCSGFPPMPEQTCNYTTPSGLLLQTYTMWNQYWTDINTTTNSTIDTEKATLISFASLVWDSSDNTSLHVTECTLSWCAKTYRDAFASGGAFNATVDNHDLKYVNISGPYMVFKGEDLPSSSNSTFMIHQVNWQSIADLANAVLSLGTSIQYDQGQNFILGGTFDFGNAMLNNPTISDMSESLARGLTNAIRNLTSPYTNQVYGQTHVDIQHIQVRWQWLVFPAAVVFLGLLLLIATIVQSHRSASIVWKSSPLALLFHPLHGWTDKELNRDSRSDMVESAKRMRGQLSHDLDAGYKINRAA